MPWRLSGRGRSASAGRVLADGPRFGGHGIHDRQRSCARGRCGCASWRPRRKGRTLAVMGCGLDRTYPADHRQLRQAIERQGAVLSELPLGAAPHSYHFPRRNRIISGARLGVVVTEAAIESGSLITARLAAEQGRRSLCGARFRHGRKQSRAQQSDQGRRQIGRIRA